MAELRMAKVCTDIEQSKRLIKLGLDIITADMIYSVDEKGNYVLDFLSSPIIRNYYSIRNNYRIPSWSFPRMFELLPEIKNNEYYSTPELRRGLSSYWIDYPSINIEAALSADNAVDAAFKCLVWCIEHGYIKTNKSEKNEGEI